MAKYDYSPPPGAVVSQFTQAAGQPEELTPDRDVYVINRSRTSKSAVWDGREIILPPGIIGGIKYGVALHFQRKLPIPGTFNVVDQSVKSYVGILSVDRPEDCEPLSDEDEAIAETKPELIDRETVENSEGVVVVETAKARGKVPGAGAGRRQRGQTVLHDANYQGPEVTEARVQEALATTEGGVLSEIQAAERELGRRG